MFPIVGQPSADVERYLTNVFGRALQKDDHDSPWLVVDTGTPDWYLFASRRPRNERAKAIIATNEEASLLRAHRLGIGGAILMPPSTRAASAALRAARENSPPHVDVDLLSWCLASNIESWLVTWQNIVFWRQQLGGSELCALLFQLADDLELVPTMLGLPALLVSGRTREDIVSAWEVVAGSTPHAPSSGLCCVPLASISCPSAHLWLEAAFLLNEELSENQHDDMTHAIYELPSGRSVGGWAITAGADSPADLWIPNWDDRGVIDWRNSQGEIVKEVTDLSAMESFKEPVMRVPGWLTMGLRPGAPNGVLIERMASVAKRLGMKLWISNVDDSNLNHLLRLQTPLWVDGEAVPD